MDIGRVAGSGQARKNSRQCLVHGSLRVRPRVDPDCEPLVTREEPRLPLPMASLLDEWQFPLDGVELGARPGRIRLLDAGDELFGVQSSGEEVLPQSGDGGLPL
jgi:hypothetical protein